MSSFILHTLIAPYWKRTCHQGCLLKALAWITGHGGWKAEDLSFGLPEFAGADEVSLLSVGSTCMVTTFCYDTYNNIYIVHILWMRTGKYGGTVQTWTCCPLNLYAAPYRYPSEFSFDKQLSCNKKMNNISLNQPQTHCWCWTKLSKHTVRVIDTVKSHWNGWFSHWSLLSFMSPAGDALSFRRTRGSGCASRSKNPPPKKRGQTPASF